MIVVGALAISLVGGGFILRADTPVSERAMQVPILRTQFEERIRTEGGEAAYRAFRIESEKTPIAQHILAHLFGESLYYVEGFPGVQVCDGAFDYGCYHGFFIATAVREGISSITNMDAACRDAPTASTCQHGIGHGILQYVGQEKLLEALALCDHTENMPGGCESGVFMQYNLPQVEADNGSSQTVARALHSPPDPYDPCPSLPSRYQDACYQSLPSWWREVYTGEYKRMGRFCDQVPNEEFRSTCFIELGVTIASGASFMASTIVERCRMVVAEDGETLCLRAAAHRVQEHMGDLYQAHLVCASLPISSSGDCPAALTTP